MEIADELKALALRNAKQSFTPEAYARMDEDERAERGLACAIAGCFRWDGLAIMRVFHEALEDANFHEEAAQVEKMIERIEAMM